MKIPQLSFNVRRRQYCQISLGLDWEVVRTLFRKKWSDIAWDSCSMKTALQNILCDFYENLRF